MIKGQNKINLIKALSKITNEDDMEKFLNSLCSESEIDKMSQRLFVAELFMNCAQYKDIVKETNASTATLAKIKYDLYYGNRGLLKGLEAL